MAGESVTIEMTRDFKRFHVNKNSTQQDVDNFSILKLKSIFKKINNSFVCSRQTSDYANERALNRAETSVGKSDEISNYRFSGGRWAKPSNRDIFGGVV